MPKFIYTILVIILINVGALVYILNQTSPEEVIPKLIFSFLILLIIQFTYPLLVTIYKKITKSKEELNSVFKSEFKKTTFISTFFGVLIFLKLNQNINNLFFTVILIAGISLHVYLKKIKKNKKRAKY